MATEDTTKLCKMLQRLEERWNSGKVNSPQEIVKLDRKMKELKKKIQSSKA
jgi:hypothetical protein